MITADQLTTEWQTDEETGERHLYCKFVAQLTTSFGPDQLGDGDEAKAEAAIKAAFLRNVYGEAAVDIESILHQAARLSVTPWSNEWRDFIQRIEELMNKYNPDA